MNKWICGLFRHLFVYSVKYNQLGEHKHLYVCRICTTCGYQEITLSNTTEKWREI